MFSIIKHNYHPGSPLISITLFHVVFNTAAPHWIEENPPRIFLLIHIQSGALCFMSHLAPSEETEHVRNMTEEVSETSLTKTISAES